MDTHNTDSCFFVDQLRISLVSSKVVHRDWAVHRVSGVLTGVTVSDIS